VLAKLDATEEKNTELAKSHDIKAGPQAVRSHSVELGIGLSRMPLRL
jgi:hypothetical protein